MVKRADLREISVIATVIQQRTVGRYLIDDEPLPRRVADAIKQEIFEGDILPDHDAALKHLLDIKDKVLAETWFRKT